MSFYEEVFNIYLEAFSILYVQVGKIELTLRNLIPQYLSSKSAHEKGTWFAPLEFNLENRRKIKNTLNFLAPGKEEIQNYLPLNFWTQLFTAKNYQSLWIPYLHYCFPNLKNPKSKRSFKEIEFLMKDLYEIRNQIAHYSFSRIEQLPIYREKLARLQFLLGIKFS